MRWALISGTSTGIGRALALGLLSRGVSVLAGVRTAQDADKLMAAAGPAANRVVPLMLDVTRSDQIGSAFEKAAELTGSDGLWTLVNNAGIAVPGPLEYLSLDDWRRQFDVNFFGVVAMTQRFLPLLRRGAEIHGRGVPRIMIVSSIAGRVAQPILAPYSSSKWAATSLGDSLRLELRRQGIGVTVLEPGAVATPIWDKGDRAAQAHAEDRQAREHYGPEIDAVSRMARKAAAAAAPVDEIASIALRALMSKKAPARVLAGRDAKIAALLRVWLPLSWFDALLVRQFGLAHLPPAGSAAD